MPPTHRPPRPRLRNSNRLSAAWSGETGVTCHTISAVHRSAHPASASSTPHVAGSHPFYAYRPREVLVATAPTSNRKSNEADGFGADSRTFPAVVYQHFCGSPELRHSAPARFMRQTEAHKVCGQRISLCKRRPGSWRIPGCTHPCIASYSATAHIRHYSPCQGL